MERSRGFATRKARERSYGSKNSQIATLIERRSRYVMLTTVASKGTEAVVDA